MSLIQLCSLIAIMLASLSHSAPLEAADVEADDVLKTLRAGHPRLMLTDQRLAELKGRHETDKALQRIVRQAIRRADRAMEKPELVYEKKGPRLLHVSRDCLGRIQALGFAYRWTGEKKYAERAIRDLRAVCGFEDWNPTHFLDTAEMSHAVGLGYDWLYEAMDEPTRRAIREGLIRNGLEPGLRAVKENWWFFRSAFNWNQVCNGGLVIGALAVAETDPDYARRIVPAAVQSLPKALAGYAPDGAWPEGPAYWHYATRYTAYGLAAMRTGLGTDFGLGEAEGLAEAGWFPVYGAGPTGLYLHYADCRMTSRRRPMACTFWLARTYDDPALADAEHALLAKYPAEPMHAVWYAPPSGEDRPRLDRDKHFGGPVPIGVFRSAWNDPDALFVGVKAGYNQVNHGHLDLGGFEMHALGVRWATDLGSDYYNLPGYWQGRPGGKRWSYYRLNSHSHSVPLIDDRDQAADAESSVLAFRSEPDGGGMVIDLTSAYPEVASRVHRGVALTADRRAVLVQDEFELVGARAVTWAMTTRAAINAKGDGTAELTLKGQRLLARILSPAGATFSQESAERKKPQARNTGYRRLLVRLPKATGTLRIAVLLIPQADRTDATRTVELTPLGRW